jgi:hypothetical protein
MRKTAVLLRACARGWLLLRHGRLVLDECGLPVCCGQRDVATRPLWLRSPFE